MPQEIGPTPLFATGVELLHPMHAELLGLFRGALFQVRAKGFAPRRLLHRFVQNPLRRNGVVHVAQRGLNIFQRLHAFGELFTITFFKQLQRVTDLLTGEADFVETRRRWLRA